VLFSHTHSLEYLQHDSSSAWKRLLQLPENEKDSQGLQELKLEVCVRDISVSGISCRYINCV
jgi:hypothetical protein